MIRRKVILTGAGRPRNPNGAHYQVLTLLPLKHNVTRMESLAGRACGGTAVTRSRSTGVARAVRTTIKGSHPTDIPVGDVAVRRLRVGAIECRRLPLARVHRRLDVRIRDGRRACRYRCINSISIVGGVGEQM